MHDRVRQYIESLVRLGLNSTNEYPPERLTRWRHYFDEWTQQETLLSCNWPLEDKLEALPRLLSLIHPDFRHDQQGNQLKLNIRIYETADSNWNALPLVQTCQSTIVLGHKCPFPIEKNGDSRLEADHVWPKSFGGPWSTNNRIWLCRLHNQMKGSSITHYSWNIYPVWLDKLLKALAYCPR